MKKAAFWGSRARNNYIVEALFTLSVRNQFMKSFYRKGRYWLMGVCVMMSLCAKAQTYGYKLFDSYEGKQIFELSDVAEIDSGRLLIAGPAGPLVFDGYTFKRPMRRKNLNYYWFWSLVKDAKGRTWGISRDGSIQQIQLDTVISHPANDTLTELLTSRMHTGLRAGANDTLYVILRHRNYYFKVAPDGGVEKVEISFEGLQNTVYCKDMGDGLVTAVSPWSVESDTVHLMFENQVFSFSGNEGASEVNTLKYEDNYLITHHKHVYLIENDGRVKDTSISSPVLGVLRDSKGLLWFATEKGVECWSGGMKKRLFRVLENTACSAVYEDSEGIMWMTTRNGLYRQESSFLLKYWRDEEAYFETDFFTSFFSSDSSFYMYNGNGIATMGPTGMVKTEMRLYPEGGKGQVFDDELFCYANGIYQKSASGFYRLPLSFSYFQPLSNEDGTFWVMSPGNVIKVNRMGQVLFNAKDSFEQFPDIQYQRAFSKPGFVDESERLWFHTMRKVFILSEEGVEQVMAPEESEQTLDNVTAIRKVGNVVWIAARDGFWTYYQEQLNFYPSTDSVLHYNSFIEQESDSALWMLGVNGGMRIAFRTEDNAVLLHTDILDHKSGIGSMAIWASRFWNGHMWFSSKEGVSRLNVKDWLRLQKKTPTALVTHVNQNAALAQERLSRFQHDENNVSVTFKTHSKLGDVLPKYRYRLLGADSTWHSTVDTQAIFSGLKPGRYQFEVKAINGLGKESDEAAVYAFVVDSPFWKTWWFLLMSFLGLQSLVGGIIWRMNTMRRKVMASEKDALEAELKTLRMQINPHFMYNALNAIGGGRDEAAAHQMAEFANLSRMILEASRQKIISLSDELEIASTYLRFITKYSEGNVQHEVQIAPEVKGSLEMVEVPPLLLQPLLENAIQHGASKVQEGRVRLAVNHTDNLVEITIEDNGLGMANSTQRPDRSASAGIPILVERIEKLNRARDGNIKISWQNGNNKDQGTLVRITIPHTTK